MDEYQYKVSDFEGPLDLLLHLIEKNKVDIYNIPIAEIADQFNMYVERIKTFDVNYASKFFVMAATLLQMKSRLLLPKPPKTAVSEEEDLQGSLVRQLVEYKRFKDISAVISQLWDSRSRMLERPSTALPNDVRFVGTIDKEALYKAFRLVYEALDEKKPPEIRIAQEIYSVEECMRRVIYTLRRSPYPTAVVTVFRQCRSGMELVITFLAVLELIKIGQCRTVAEGEDGNAVALRYVPRREA